MSQAKNKLRWCLKKAESELKVQGKHRGLIKIKPDKEKAKEYILKAEHYFNATEYLKKGDYSDISASTIFYSMYHCLLAIAAKFGYESGNQECTFALIYALIEDKEIDFSLENLEKISELDASKNINTTINIREQYQYGTKLSLDDDTYKDLVELAKKVLSNTKVIIEA
jgi:uncharacterized protein (UPF0332 family)